LGRVAGATPAGEVQLHALPTARPASNYRRSAGSGQAPVCPDDLQARVSDDPGTTVGIDRDRCGLSFVGKADREAVLHGSLGAEAAPVWHPRWKVAGVGRWYGLSS